MSSVVSHSEFLSQLTSPSESHKEVILRCPFLNCNCRIIPLKNHSSIIESNSINVVSGSPKCITLDPESLEIINTERSNDKYYKFTDSWDFDNIGVSRPTEVGKPIIQNMGEIKVERFLVCADCEKGPIGFAGYLIDQVQETDYQEDDRVRLANQLIYFLCADSVRYELH